VVTVVGIVLLALLAAAVIVGLMAGGGDAADRFDTWTARTALGLVLLGEVGMAVLVTSLGPDDLPVLVAFAAVPLVLTAVPFVLRADARVAGGHGGVRSASRCVCRHHGAVDRAVLRTGRSRTRPARCPAGAAAGRPTCRVTVRT
jgi:hypothetical protein